MHLYFYGSPGVGKSRTAKAIANHLGVSIVTADLAIAVIEGVEARAQQGQYDTERFLFNSA